jgi:hypothetical protein
MATWSNTTKSSANLEYLLTEAGDFLTTELGEFIITNQSLSWSNNPKNSATWSNNTKN